MMMRNALLFFLTLIFVCCSNPRADERLRRVDRLASDSPREALDSLKNINYDLLTDADKHFYDFLSVKTADKAYIPHISDSLILSVIDYESTHKWSGRYAESLYYGGRVYSDLGDYPTALKYFQDALSELTPESDIRLRGSVMSQIGRLLNKLRLYDEAIPYLEKTLHIDSIENDKFNLVYDNQLIGSIYLHSKKPDKAIGYFRDAMDAASALSSEDRSNMTVYVAACELESGDLDSALALIRDAVDSVSPSYRNLSLAYASDIYLKAGIRDTAYAYAFELAHSEDQNNRKCGYENLLSAELRDLTPTDSIARYVAEYKDILEHYYDEHGDQQALIQDSLYNYHIHERERFNAEKSRAHIIIGCCVALLVLLILIVVFLVYRIRTKQTIIKLHETIARFDSIKQMMECPDTKDMAPISSDPESLRKQLRLKISQIDISRQSESIPQEIIETECYKTLQRFIADKKFIPDSNPLWNDLLNAIVRCSPDFQHKLNLLFGRSMRQHELQTIILIKCGVTPTQMTYLLGKTKGSISSRRETLGFKILDEKINLKYIDAIIRSL
jgi:tetratricopeptide (TPR) repeat protein